MKSDFVNEMYKWALECKNNNANFNFNYQSKMTLLFVQIAVAVVGLNTRLGCLDSNLAKDSEAQKMINAVQTTFSCMNQMEFKLPTWKYFMTKDLRKLFDAQDFFTE